MNGIIVEVTPVNDGRIEITLTGGMVMVEFGLTPHVTIEGSSGGGGHTIQDAGTSMAQQEKLNFVGFTVENDAVNGATKITNPFTSLLKAAYDACVTWISTNGTNLLTHIGITQGNPHGTTYSDVGAAAVNHAHTGTYEAVGVAAGLVDGLKDGVADAGNTLQKLYNILIGSFTEIPVATIAARDALNITHTPTNVFVSDDGDGNWALYKATTTGTNATYVKLSDPDLLNAVMSASTIKTAYESNSDTNCLTNALKQSLETAYSHSQSTHAPADAVSLNTVKNDTDINDAISKKHAAGSDNETAQSIIALGIDELEFSLVMSYFK